MTTSLREIEDARDLGAALQPDVNVVLWRRTLTEALSSEAAAALVSGWPGWHATLASAADSEELLRRQWPALAADVACLRQALEHHFTPGVGTLSLSAATSQECRKFHVDHVRLRAVCAYRGPGTELVPDPWVRREFLCSGGDDVDGANRRIVPDAARIVRPQAGDLVALKGAALATRGRGAVHRSPPASPASPRLVLKITFSAVTPTDGQNALG